MEWWEIAAGIEEVSRWEERKTSRRKKRKVKNGEGRCQDEELESWEAGGMSEGVARDRSEGVNKRRSGRANDCAGASVHIDRERQRGSGMAKWSKVESAARSNDCRSPNSQMKSHKHGGKAESLCW